MIKTWLALLLFVCNAYAFDIDVTRVALRTGTGTQDITFSNFSEDCTAVTCAAIFVLSTGVSDGTAAADAMLGIGFTDGTTGVSFSSRSQDGADTMNTFRGQRTTTELIHTVTLAGLEGYAAFSAWLANGIRINVVDDFAAQYLLTVAIIGDSALQANVGIVSALNTVDGVTDITTVGFEASLALLAGTRLSSVGDSGTAPFLLSVGVAVNDGASTQGSIGCYSGDGVSSADVRAVTSSLYALQYAHSDTDSRNGAFQVGQWDASGFSLTERNEAISAPTGVGYLALDIGTQEAAVLDVSTPTTIGSNTVSVGFESVFGLLLGTLARSYDVGEDDADAGGCMIGVATADAQYVQTVHDDDLASFANAESLSNDVFLQMEADDGTCIAGSCLVGTLTGFGATDWALNYSSVFSDASRRLIGLAIGAAAAPSGRRRGVHVIQ